MRWPGEFDILAYSSYQYQYATLDILRLYYLHQGSSIVWMKEESILQILYWLSPTMGIVFSTTYMIENAVHDNSFSFHISYCRKTSFTSTMIFNIFSVNSCMCLTTISIIGEFVAHMFIFTKISSIESRAEVYEIRGNRLVCHSRHQRNVVSALGHFFSFVVSMLYQIFIFIAIYTINDPILTIAKFVSFLVPCIKFFIHPLIETLSTHNLRQSIFS